MTVTATPAPPVTPAPAPAAQPKVVQRAATAVGTVIHSYALDVGGLGFVGADLYGFITNRVPGANLLTLTAIAVAYVGIKVGTSPAS